MIDPATRHRLHAAQQVALIDGKDIFETLDSFKLLATPERLAQSQVAALYSAVLQLEEQHTQTLVDIGGGTNCAADAHRGAVEFLKFVIKQFEQRGQQ